MTSRSSCAPGATAFGRFAAWLAPVPALLCALSALPAHAVIFGRVSGVVHDTQHRPVANAHVQLRASHSDFVLTAVTGDEGAFAFATVPLGEYVLLVERPGFAAVQQSLTLASDTTPVLHLELQPGTVEQHLAVQGSTASGDSVTPTTLMDRQRIADTPGADRTDSLAMITDYVPGAYMTHDMLHMRGGHQVSWQLDGVEIPNTNIASNLGAQVDPKDIDYLEVQRGSYTAEVGDRTYGVFNVVPRTGFERDRQGEVVLSAGSFFQTNDQVNFGDHTQRFAWYASLNGNRSDYGLAPPVARVVHDADNGYGGLVSLVGNKTPQDQLRLLAQARRDFFQIPYDPDPSDFENQQFDSSGLRDTQAEADSLATFSWLHTFHSSAVLQLSPFFHYNSADYAGGAADTPVATTNKRTSSYGGAQINLTGEIKRHTLQGGLYSFGQHDSYLFGAAFNDGTGTAPFRIPDAAAGGVVEEYLSDNWKATDWLTIIAGMRQSWFDGTFTESHTDPRVGVAVRVPRLGWVLRAFYGRFYQPPPLLTASGPVVEFAQANNTTFTPLHGERDEEHQFGLQIPYKGWVLDIDTFKTRVNNFLDHANLGDSSIYFPVTVDGALVRAWELTLTSPRLWRIGQAHVAYSNQIAEQRGALTGGLVCAPVNSPECDVGPGYTPVDHDQRNTLAAGVTAALPRRTTASLNVAYGSGFTNGSPDPTTPYPGAYLPQHASVDLSVGKALGEHTSVTVTALNVANQRTLLDNSLTFGGFHYNDPRELYGELRYRFHF